MGIPARTAGSGIGMLGGGIGTLAKLVGAAAAETGAITGVAAATAAGAIGLGVVVPKRGMGAAAAMNISGECTELDLEVTSLEGGATGGGLGAWGCCS